MSAPTWDDREVGAAIRTLRQSDGKFGVLRITYGQPRTLSEKYRAMELDPPWWFTAQRLVAEFAVYGWAVYGFATAMGWV